MATFHDAAVSRKKITTYGKAARRRIPEYGFTSMARKSQIPDLQTELPRSTFASASTAPTTLLQPRPPTPKLKPVRPRSRSRSRTPAAKFGDIFDVPLSDDEEPVPKPRKAMSSSTKQKHARSRSVSRTRSSNSSPADIFDVPDSDEDAPAPKPVSKMIRKTASTPPAKLKSILRRSPSKAPSPPSPAKDIYDIPSDAEPLKPVQRIARAHPAKQPKTTSVRQRSVSVSAPAATPKKDIFDVPSDEERIPTPKAIFKVTKKVAVNGGTQVDHKPPISTEEDAGSRKKLKVSPVESTLKRLPANNPRPAPKPRVKNPGGRNTSPKSGQLTKMVERLKVQPVPEKKQDPPQTPRKLSISQEPSAPSVSLSDVDMADVDPSGRHISPQGRDMWQALLESAEVSEESTTGSEHDGVELDNGKKMGSSAARLETRVRSPLSRPAGISKPARKNTLKPPRRRLIDSLVEQAAESSNEESSDVDETSESDHSKDLDIVMEDAPNSHSALPPALVSESQSSQTMGPKFTYARQRSMLNEEDLMSQLAMELPTMPSENQGRRGRRASIPTLKPLSSFNEASEDEDDSVAAIRSVHELRQAGANNRFMDEVQDFLERIGSPGKTTPSMRRSGLLDLAHKLQDKNFSRQFRSNGMEQKLFLHLGQETEIMAGFLMATILITVLMEGSMPHIVAHLRRQGITRLLIRLLECQSDITVVAKDRKSNMSKVAQSLVSEYQVYLLQLPVWEELKPQSLSPRTVALKCLEQMVRQTRESGNSGDILSKELTTNLFAILKSASDERSWALPKEKIAIDFYLALSALESHSLAARTIQDETIWINEYLPIIADTLQISLNRPLGEFGALQILLLKLTLNVTNNNPRASDIFARAGLMSGMGQVLVTRFKQIVRFMREEDLSIAMDHLILVLGVMINFAEWSPDCRHSLQSLKDKADDPLDGMVQAFADSLERTSQADSVQESQKNVAFGYLSVLLGFFSLLPALSERIKAKQPRKTLRPVVASIEEFIGHHKTVDMIAADEDGYNPQTGLTKRLENLVSKLADLKGLGKK